jgi:hypothetical protein
MEGGKPRAGERRMCQQGGVKAAAVDVGVQRLLRHSLARDCASQGQHLPPSTVFGGDAYSDGCRL